MLKELSIFAFGHKGVNIKALAKDWKDFVDTETPMYEGKPYKLSHDPTKDVVESFTTNGIAALSATEGQRNMKAARLAALRAGRFKQNEPQPGDNPHDLRVGTVNKLSTSILGDDEEARAIAKHFKLEYHPIRPPEGVPANMTGLNTAIWAARSVAAVGGVFAGEFISTQYLHLSWVNDIAYVFTYLAATTAAVPLIFTVGNAFRTAYALRRDAGVATYKEPVK